MSEKSFFCRKWVICADGRGGCLDYYRLRGNGCYGLLVELRRGELLEQGRAENLASCSEKIDALLTLLARNRVTPCALEEILQDLGNKF